MMEYIGENIILTSVVAGGLFILIMIIVSAATAAVRKKKTVTETQTTTEHYVPSPLVGAVSKRNINYEPIVEIAKILTNNHAPTVEKMRLLAGDYPDFIARNYSWCDLVARKLEPAERQDRDVLTANFVAHWLVGFAMGTGESSPEKKFGCYLTGRERPAEVIAMFEEIDKNLKYGLAFQSLSIAGIDTSRHLISELNSILNYNRYGLISFEPQNQRSLTDGAPAGIYSFIVPLKDHQRVIQMAHRVDFKIYRQISV